MMKDIMIFFLLASLFVFLVGASIWDIQNPNIPFWLITPPVVFCLLILDLEVSLEIALVVGVVIFVLLFELPPLLTSGVSIGAFWLYPELRIALVGWIIFVLLHELKMMGSADVLAAGVLLMLFPDARMLLAIGIGMNVWHGVLYIMMKKRERLLVARS